MCGICGIVDRQDVAIDPSLLSRMNARLWHRGPDEGGEWIHRSTGLAMRRLAIIDLKGGQQPMFNEDGNIAIVFNGEIYNYRDLRDKLVTAGHRFATHSDTETVIHTYEQYGPEGLARLNGMFALAIWDRREQILLLARDRAGKKPLYYCLTDGRIVFSSEMASLLEHPQISREIDEVALDNYFALGYTPPPRTIFKKVKQLPPGHFLLWKAGTVRIGPYWRLQPRPSEMRREEEAAEELLSLLKDSVRIRLYSDVPFGALLSGGVDSSLVVGLMSQLMDRPVQTFTVGFSDKELDESRYAAQVAKLFRTEHHHILARPHNAIELIRKLILHFGEPFADASAVPTYLVSEMARQHVTMALSGDGGDEVFGGYKSYRYHAYAKEYRAVPAPLRSVIRRTARKLNGRGGHIGRKLKRFVSEAEIPVEAAWFNSRSIFTEAELEELYTQDFARYISPRERGFQIRDSFAYFRATGEDSAILNHVDYETYLPGDILVKVDRMSMANSIEMRAPLLDFRIAEFAASLPREWKWTSREGKRILKRAARRILPADILNRRKQGFVLPISKWFREDLKDFARETISCSDAGHIIRLDYCQSLLDRHVKGVAGGLDRKLWSVLCFLLWHREFSR
ncbi:MAG TPA: asparagine synthase (glutamine-hydrolyzing) [Terriglobales bacterium]|nr:asparagine synthase (glutamine-hydrolyzing) [Terriglobales bacterium]